MDPSPATPTTSDNLSNVAARRTCRVGAAIASLPSALAANAAALALGIFAVYGLASEFGVASPLGVAATFAVPTGELPSKNLIELAQRREQRANWMTSLDRAQL